LEAVLIDEYAVIKRCKRGSRDAFEMIVERYKRDAYFIALGLVGNSEDAMDLSQEAFFRAYYNIKRLNSERKFFPWFYQILRNLCFSHLRKRKLRQTESIDNVDEANCAGEAGDWFDPAAVAERNENKDRVWKALGKLDDKHREVILLRHFQELSYEEMAERLFCNQGTVTSRLYYARKKLKEILDRDERRSF
jgi:RNA polymerase sigma-70 factor (ECF subfamily)